MKQVCDCSQNGARSGVDMGMHAGTASYPFVGDCSEEDHVSPLSMPVVTFPAFWCPSRPSSRTLTPTRPFLPTT